MNAQICLCSWSGRRKFIVAFSSYPYRLQLRCFKAWSVLLLRLLINCRSYVFKERMVLLPVLGITFKGVDLDRQNSGTYSKWSNISMRWVIRLRTTVMFNNKTHPPGNRTDWVLTSQWLCCEGVITTMKTLFIFRNIDDISCFTN